MAKNYCYCVSGSPSGDIQIIDNLDGTFTCPLIIQDGEGDPECDGEITLSLKDKDGNRLFTAIYEITEQNPSPNVQSPISVGGITVAEFMTDYRPFLTGNLVDGGSFDFDLAGWSLVNGCDGSLVFCFSFENPRCGGNIEGEVSTTIELLPPKASLLNESFLGGVSGIFTFEQEIKENNGLTSLVSGDLVTYKLKNELTGVLIEEIEGVYGNDISTFTQVAGSPTPLSSIILWATGLVVDGGLINIAKADWSNANNLNYQNGNFDGTNFISAAVKLQFCISAYDVSQCAFNDNADINITLERTVDLIEGSVFLQNESLNPFYLYSMYDNGGEIYNNQSSITVREGGVVIPFPLPAFIATAFPFGTRDLHAFNGVDNTTYEVDLTFDNNMNAYTNSLTRNTPGSGSDLNVSYNRSGVDFIGDTFTIDLESNIVSTVIQRVVYVGNFYSAVPPTNGLNVLQNGIVLYTNVPYINFLSVSAGMTDWFNLDMQTIGQRNTIRYEGVESGENIFNEYQLELNYIY